MRESRAPPLGGRRVGSRPVTPAAPSAILSSLGFEPVGSPHNRHGDQRALARRSIPLAQSSACRGDHFPPPAHRQRASAHRNRVKVAPSAPDTHARPRKTWLVGDVGRVALVSTTLSNERRRIGRNLPRRRSRRSPESPVATGFPITRSYHPKHLDGLITRPSSGRNPKVSRCARGLRRLRAEISAVSTAPESNRRSSVILRG